MVTKDLSRWLGSKIGAVKMGHVGTLDPMAQGVVPLLLGRATKIQDHLLELPKTYEFDVTFGYETDTLDAEGQVTKRSDWRHFDVYDLDVLLDEFRGEITQEPPSFSAVKYKGKPLYKYARKAKEIPLEKLRRKVTVHDLELKNINMGTATLEATCSKGTYIRSLARDIGHKLNTFGTLTRIVRTRCAGVDIEDASSLQEIEDNMDRFGEMVLPISNLDFQMKRWNSIEPTWSRRLRNGQSLRLNSKLLDRCMKNSSELLNEESLFLVDEIGNPIGFGSALVRDSDHIEIALRRGL